MIKSLPADSADQVFNVAIFQRQTITFLGDQTHYVQLTSTVLVFTLYTVVFGTMHSGGVEDAEMENARQNDSFRLHRLRAGKNRRFLEKKFFLGF